MVATKDGVAGLLGLSSLLLTVLVPGGPIETRSFAHINPLILGGFNTFLTTLSIVSLVLVYFVVQRYVWAFVAAAVCGMSYFLVYVLDLAHIFPVSPDMMPSALFVIELLGTIVSVPLMIVAVQAVLDHRPDQHNAEALKPRRNGAMTIDGAGISQRFIYIALALVGVGFGIITFATHAAMGL
ncbi:hypothetical protein IQ266_02980 [filamentous cyanobacterium LEGE 11480]|uniref:DUF8051 domain-containing protein n=1 Tax=Romeriopsis navalis LEGE 11480 TaxID=2777977 RepID=A0A928VJC0_9CYAN|nr:hypothetical protein [Romeriopsis navalis]MBE9028722.1 hypothetical protein [Romeriopsis navalis LEGE 11480]